MRGVLARIRQSTPLLRAALIGVGLWLLDKTEKAARRLGIWLIGMAIAFFPAIDLVWSHI